MKRSVAKRVVVKFVAVAVSFSFVPQLVPQLVSTAFARDVSIRWAVGWLVQEAAGDELLGGEISIASLEKEAPTRHPAFERAGPARLKPYGAGDAISEREDRHVVTRPLQRPERARGP